MSCFESSTFLPDHGLVDQGLLQKACDQLGWTYETIGGEMRITRTRDSVQMHRESVLRVKGNRVQWNTYYRKDGANKVAELRSVYEEIFLEMRVAYAKETVTTEFKKRGFSILKDLGFQPDAEIVDQFFIKGRSKLKQETEPNAKIKISILADASLRTDSDYIPEDIHDLADEAIDSIQALLGANRSIKPKRIPAKYKNKAFCKARNTINQNQS